MRAFLVLCLSSCVSYGIVPQTLADDHVDYYVVQSGAEPFQIVEDSTLSGGFVSEVVMALAKEAGIAIQPHTAPSPRIELLLRDPNVGDWIIYHSPAWNLISEGIFLDEPLLSVTHSLFHCAGTFAEGETLSNKRIAVISYFTYPGLNQLAEAGEIELVPVKSYEQGFKMVDLGRADGFVEMDLRLRYNLARQTEKPSCNEIDAIGDHEPQYDIFLMVNESMDHTKAARLQASFTRLKQSGEVERLLGRYSGS